MYGINVRADGVNKLDYALALVLGVKTMETRNKPTLNKFIGQRVGVVRTGRGKARLVGEITIGEPIHITDKTEFQKLFNRHLVDDDSEFRFKKEKYCYEVTNPVWYDREIEVSFDRKNGDNMTYRILKA